MILPVDPVPMESTKSGGIGGMMGTVVMVTCRKGKWDGRRKAMA